MMINSGALGVDVHIGVNVVDNDNDDVSDFAGCVSCFGFNQDIRCGASGKAERGDAQI